MSSTAIDIVLLPNPDMHKKIIDLHHELDTGNYKQAIALGEQRLPHLSLAMGGLKVDEENQLFDALSTIAKSFQGIELRFTHISQHQNSKGEVINSLEHQPNSFLEKLHQLIISNTKVFLKNPVTSDSFIGNEMVNQDSIHWVNDYFDKHSLQNFSPHITLGTGEYKGTFQTFYSTFQRLAVCHLGNYCTCQKIISEINLLD